MDVLFVNKEEIGSMRCKDKFYNKVAENVMSTYMDGIQIRWIGEKYNVHVRHVEGFSIMGKEIPYRRIKQDTILMSMIIPLVKKKYGISDIEGKKVYYLFEKEMKERVRMTLLKTQMNMIRSDVYYNNVVDTIMKNDVELDFLVHKGSNRFVTEDYTVTTIFGQGYVDKMTHFNGPSWYYIKGRISSKYAINSIEGLEYIKGKLQSLFEEYEQREVLQ
jgi:hypothetical protein